MRIILSAAVTADGFLDDTGPQRLMISTPGDWAAVGELRARCDAILVGAETLRRDNPALLLRDGEARRRRMARGLRPDLTKVALTRSGEGLDPAMRFFTEGDADRLLFAERAVPGLEQVAEVIVSDAPWTAAALVTALERRGIGTLLVEGGARTLSFFLDAGLADELRLAVNPALTLGEARGGARFRFEPPADVPGRRERIDGMEVTTWLLRPDTAREDRLRLREAIAASRRCEPCATSYCVGAVVVTASGECFTGYTHETSPTHHAEQEAIAKALYAGAELRGASIFSSMEPCSARSSEPESCSELILRHGFAHVAFALYEPDRFVCCRGAQMLREAGVDVRCYPELGEEVRAVNAHLLG